MITTDSMFKMNLACLQALHFRVKRAVTECASDLFEVPFACYSQVTSRNSTKWRDCWQVKINLKTKKTANICNHWFPHEMSSEERLQKYKKY